MEYPVGVFPGCNTQTLRLASPEDAAEGSADVHLRLSETDEGRLNQIREQREKLQARLRDQRIPKGQRRKHS